MLSPATVPVECKRRSQKRAGQNGEIAAFWKMLFAAELYRSRQVAPTIERLISSDNEPLDASLAFRSGLMSVRGQYLVSARHMKDPNFARTVVLMVEHNDTGSMGLVLNRPTAVDVRSALSGHFELPEADAPVFYGGPVETQALFLLHDSAEQAGGELPVLPGLFVGANADVFEKIVVTAAATGARYKVFAGCAGWGTGQLDGELSRGDWHVAPADVETVFAGDPYALWDQLIDELSRHPLFPDATGDHRMN